MPPRADKARRLLPINLLRMHLSGVPMMSFSSRLSKPLFNPYILICFYFLIMSDSLFCLFGLPMVTGLCWPNNGFNPYFSKSYFPIVTWLW